MFSTTNFQTTEAKLKQQEMLREAARQRWTAQMRRQSSPGRTDRALRLVRR